LRVVVLERVLCVRSNPAQKTAYRNPATQLIYASNDVAGYQYLRIPGTFGTAHVFGGTMVTSLPFMYGAWSSTAIGNRKRALLLAGMIAGLPWVRKTCRG